MPKDLIFFSCSCIIMLLTAINLSVGPIISKKVGKDAYFGNWATLNCEKKSDEYEFEARLISSKRIKYTYKREKDECYRKKDCII